MSACGIASCDKNWTAHPLEGEDIALLKEKRTYRTEFLRLPTALLLPTTAYYYVLLPTTTYYYLLLPTTTYYYLHQPTTTYYDLLLLLL